LRKNKEVGPGRRRRGGDHLVPKMVTTEAGKKRGPVGKKWSIGHLPISGRKKTGKDDGRTKERASGFWEQRGFKKQSKALKTQRKEAKKEVRVQENPKERAGRRKNRGQDGAVLNLDVNLRRGGLSRGGKTPERVFLGWGGSVTVQERAQTKTEPSRR